MYEVFALLTDSLGTRAVPTGDGSPDERIAENLRLKRMIAEPTTEFFIDWTPTEDEFNAF